MSDQSTPLVQRAWLLGIGGLIPFVASVAALWLGAGLGALNWVLLALWPVILVALQKGSAAEERMLREKFGEAYAAYAAGKGRLLPTPRSVAD